jgi:alpha-L-fucosidase
MTHENKFGMFIHWGIFALTELQDQAVARYDMDVREYEKLKDKFNPVKYDPDAWVLAAKNAGMKYICFTAKHHDGFCMWDTKYTDYNVMNTPYGKDVLKMLADACHRHGMLLSIYYSNPDWNYYYGFNPHATHQWKQTQRTDINVEKYKEFVKNQITELMTNYGPIYSLFWDITPRLVDPSLNELVRRLQPGIYINDRGWSEGDFSTPEREYATACGSRFEKMTEACNSIGEQSWGYRAKEDYYSMRHLISSIDRIMAMGGSYLLNVGPHHDGTFPLDYTKRLARIGDWYNRMEGALECHEEDSFSYEVMNNEYLATKKNGKTHLHFPTGLISDAIAIKNYPSLPKSVRLLNTGKELEFAVERLPEFFDLDTGIANFYLHITGIPVDDLASEAIVIEIDWC